MTPRSSVDWCGSVVRRRAFARRVLAAVLVWASAAPVGLAQNPKRPPANQPGPSGQKGVQRPPQEGERPPRRPLGPRQGRLPPGPDRGAPGDDGLGFSFDGRFGPTETDFGPLRPGEDSELLSFLSKHAPPVYQNLQRLRDGGPQEFRDAVEELAPRLRFLRRLHAENPALARGLLRLADVQQRLRRMRREFHSAPPVNRPRIAQAARQEIGELVRLQGQVMRMRVDDLVENRERYIAADFQRLTRADVELTGEPDDVAALAERYAAAHDAERDTAAESLRGALGRRLDAEVSEMRRAIQRRGERAAAEIDRRLRAMFGEPDPPDRP